MDSAGVFFVPVCTALGFTRAELSTYLTAYFIGTTLAMPFVGKYLTKLNLRLIMSICAVLVAGAIALMGTYTQVWQWQLSGLVLGLAGSCIFILPAASMICNWFSKKRGIAYGVVTSFSGIGAAVFAPLLNYYISAFGWRIAYGIAGLICIACILPWTLFVFRLRPEDMGMKPYGYEETSEDSGSVQRHGISFARAWKSVSFIALFVFGGVVAAYHGINPHLPGFAQSIGYSAATGALLISAISIGSIADRLLMGVLNDRWGVQKTTLLQLVVVSMGLLGFMSLIIFRIPISSAQYVILVAALFFGVHDSLMSVSIPLLIRQIFGSKDYTAIHANIRVGVGLFGAGAPVAVGYLYDTTGGFVGAFAGLIAVSILGALLIVIAYIGRRLLTFDPV
ncbi:MAG: MFS transporter [Coriobacteriia bacterium]|nr:MFS transporter [Coriobacteriia bacterium]